MAFGAKIKLSVDSSSKGTLHNQIQSAVDAATTSNPIYLHNIKLTKSSTNQLISDLKSRLKTENSLIIPIKKIDATTAVANLRKDLEYMLSGLSITGLKDYLGTAGVEASYDKAAASANRYADAIENGRRKSQAASTALRQLKDIQNVLSSSYKNIGNLSESNPQASELLAKYQELNAEVTRLMTSEEAQSQEAINGLSAETIALKQKVLSVKEVEEATKRAANEQARSSETACVSIEKQSNLLARMSRYLQVNTKIASSDSGRIIQSMIYELNSGTQVTTARFKEMEAQFARIKAQAIETGQAGKTMMDRISSAYQKFGGWSLITRSMMSAIRVIKQMYTNVSELDTAMTELKKVTDETKATYDNFFLSSATEAKSLGATVTDKISASADFARLGFSIDDSSKLADAALVYKNVGDGIDSIDDASESIISTMKAFNVETEDAMYIVDKFNEVGNNFAISSKGVGDALLRSASALHTANNSLDESIALVTAANSTIQDAEKVGTALKTVSMYLRAAKTEVEDAGESTEGMANSVSELRAELLTLTNGKVDIQIDENTFKSTYQIMKELSEVWGNLQDITRANILEMIGGKRNANVVTSLLENFDIAEDVINTSEGSRGSALTENEKYLDSIAGKTAQFQTTFEELSASLMESDSLKFLIDRATEFLELINGTAKTLGSFPMLITAIAGALSSIKNVGELINQFRFLIILRFEYAHKAYTNGNTNETVCILVARLRGALAKQDKLV